MKKISITDAYTLGTLHGDTISLNAIKDSGRTTNERIINIIEDATKAFKKTPPYQKLQQALEEIENGTLTYEKGFNDSVQKNLGRAR